VEGGRGRERIGEEMILLHFVVIEEDEEEEEEERGKTRGARYNSFFCMFFVFLGVGLGS
jgi:hypothetical protein